MRKIISRSEKERLVKRNQLIIGGVLIFLMIFSTLGFAFSGRIEENKEDVSYKNVDFIKEGDFWKFETEGFEFITRYNPYDVENISFFNSLTLQDYLNKPLYFVGTPGEPFAEFENNLLRRFVVRTSMACLEDNNCEGDFPIKNCSEDNIIIIEEVDYNSNYTEIIEQREKCVFIRAGLSNQTKYADAYLFDLIGIR
jgi:hypothetical protein